MQRVSPILSTFMVAIHTLFLASFVFSVYKRNWPVLVLVATVFLKILIHAVTVAQPRYFMPAIALEWLVIALSVDDAMSSRKIIPFVLATASAAAIVFLLVIVSLKAQAYILTHDESVQRGSRSSRTQTVLCVPGLDPSSAVLDLTSCEKTQDRRSADDFNDGPELKA